MKIIDCDVIVVNYNAGKLLVDCVRSALVEGARKVVVVDNDSHYRFGPVKSEFFQPIALSLSMGSPVQAKLRQAQPERKLNTLSGRINSGCR
jgi:GT2 family glycosyltransferase